MKYSVVMKGDQVSKEVNEKLISGLEGYLDYDEENPDLVITIGGDGTVLEAVQKYVDKIDKVMFVGIHTGHLGFYVDWLPIEVEELVEHIKSNVYKVVEFPVLEVVVRYENNSKNIIALNEITLVNSLRTQHFNIFIDAEYFESFRGTGVCISTPSGSTAYNKSLGGAIIHPKVPAYQLTEMASINNTIYRTIGSPMILHKDQKLLVTSKNFEGMTLTHDHLISTFNDIKEIEFNLSDKKVKFARFRKLPFWHRVNRSFIGGTCSID